MSDEQNSQVPGQSSEITLDKLQSDLDSAMNGWKRTAADFENYKRRKETENRELVEFAREVTVAKLLPTLDSLEQALRHLPAADDPEFAGKYRNWQAGVTGIVGQLDKTLAELGVRKIEAVGKKFDPNFHEAVREVEGEQDQMVVEELQTGFELNGKVIRPSQVVISKRKL
ncbi:MAG TPA: nucleotide exchange factor GrpE [Patescibacteria group bacterium]|nr:nucleotide exchange factor GrpE [Patescibacteria group bacterium]